MSVLTKKQLIIVAGPNGAGKSTYSAKFSDKDAIVFDPDKESQKVQDTYQNLPIDGIYYFINNHFQDQIAKAIKSKKDFILETNFRDFQLMETVDQFKNKGYAVNLMYFLLSSEKESMHRVTSRVNKGGHFVDTHSIRLNYDEGLKNLMFFAHRFDNVFLLDATHRIGEQEPLLNIERDKVKFISQKIPNWAEPVIQGLMSALRISPHPQKDNNPQTGFDR
ncbi:zeta toxin family protein [Mucilaginibacter sp. BJC16-A38]|uniref:zeta toxin family protein n=1 Tax=Mucilaginibacter phenanthrenivorans TaxID=1234842 RepID=UPI002157D898|nr:zeta toxin family protein [Mucilaginibacter phenanthrenivorans]MCR8556479.1 zeta toxin family protein [Mucilaginibacter phenanthrenivorans]